MTIVSLGGVSRRFTGVALGVDTPWQMWDSLQQQRVNPFAEVAGMPLVLLLPGRPPRRVVLDLPLLAQGAVREGESKVGGCAGGGAGRRVSVGGA